MLRHYKAVIVILIFLITQNAYGVVSSGAVYEVRAGEGNDLNGGGFNKCRFSMVPGTFGVGVDYSQQASAQVQLLNCFVLTGALTKIHCTAGQSIPNNATGNTCLLMRGATGVVMEILAIHGSAGSPDPSFTVSGNAAASTFQGMPVNMGGCWRTLEPPNLSASAAIVAGNNIWIKSGNYTKYRTAITSVLAPTVGGTAGNPISWIGYANTRGDNPVNSNRPTLRGDSSLDGVRNTANGIVIPQSYNTFINLIMKNFTSYGVSCSAYDDFINCKVMQCTTSGFYFSAGGNTTINCEASNINGIGFHFAGATISRYINCYSHDNYGRGFAQTTVGENLYLNCIACRNTGVGFSVSGNTLLWNCISTNNTGATSDGIQFVTTGNGKYAYVYNTISANNGRYGICGALSAANQLLSDYNIIFGNTTAATYGYGLGYSEGPNTIYANPQMKNVTEAIANFSVYGNSPAIGNGYNPMPATGAVTMYKMNRGIDQTQYNPTSYGSAQ